jgi:glycosyltransferase involved in cell wall biosynthesis
VTKILVRGPALSQSGYGEHCRSVLRALKSKKQNDIYLVNVGWGESGWIYEDTDERRWIDSLILKTAQATEPEFDLSVQVQLPIEWQQLAKKNIGVTAGVETDTIPATWAEASEQMDAIIVPSQHTKDGFSQYKNLLKKISVIGYPVRRKKTQPLDLGLSTASNFLTVAQWSPRKNIEQLLSAFIQEFMNEDVGLILKVGLKNGSEIDRHYTKERLDTFLKGVPSNKKCRIYLLHGTMSEAEMAALYKDKNITAYVTTTHGEGYGLPSFDAATSGLPIIAANWGGIREYSSIEGVPMVVEIDHTVDNVKDYQQWSGVLETTAKWCFPDITSLRSKMREVHSDSSAAKKNAMFLQAHLNKQFSNKNINTLYNKVITQTLKENKNETK